METIKLIYIIDDDLIYTKLVKFYINKFQFSEECETFQDGHLAIDKIRKTVENGGALPDLILLDLNMPLFDGWEFMDEFSKLDLPKRVPVFISTSSINPDDIENAKKYELVREFVSKPINKEKLDLIKSML